MINTSAIYNIPITATLFFVLLFMLNPAMCIVALFTYIIIEKQYQRMLLPFCISGILFLCLLNTVKIPVSDQILYNQLYESAGHTAFLKYLFIWNKEPVFTLINWILYYTLQGSVTLYSFVLTLLSYSLLSFSIYRFCKANKYPYEISYLAILSIFFIPYIYVLSLHITRQFLANTLLIYILVEHIFYHRKIWLSIALSIIMCLIHSSSALFIPFLFLLFLQKRISKKNIIYYGLIFVGLLTYKLLAASVLPSLGNDTVNYISQRASYDAQVETATIPTYVIALEIITFITIFYIIDIKKYKFKNEKVIYFMHIILFLIIFILLNYNQELISERYTFYLWLFYPFCIAFFFNYLNKKVFVCYGAGILLILFFLFHIESLSRQAIWVYKLPLPIYECSLFHFF